MMIESRLNICVIRASVTAFIGTWRAYSNRVNATHSRSRCPCTTKRRQLPTVMWQASLRYQYERSGALDSNKNDHYKSLYFANRSLNRYVLRVSHYFWKSYPMAPHCSLLTTEYSQIYWALRSLTHRVRAFFHRKRESNSKPSTPNLGTSQPPPVPPEPSTPGPEEPPSETTAVVPVKDSGNMSSCAIDLKVVWFNFAAPPRTPITKKIDYTR